MTPCQKPQGKLMKYFYISYFPSAQSTVNFTRVPLDLSKQGTYNSAPVEDGDKKGYVEKPSFLDKFGLQKRKVKQVV